MSGGRTKDRSDKTLLSATGTALIVALKAELPGLGLTFKNQPRLEDVHTDGWSIVIARMGSGLPVLQVYLDRFNGGAARHFWYGFGASKAMIIAKATQAYHFKIGAREIMSADLVQAKGVYSLRKPIDKLEANDPVPESYRRDNEFYFGIYSFTQDEDALIKEASKFFVPTIRGILKDNSRSADLSEVAPGDRELIHRLVRDRQAEFRTAILRAYDGACAVTGCRVEECLEATHLDRFASSYSNSVTNGILLRADLHRLMDAGLMTFSWSGGELTVKIDASIKETVYCDLDHTLVRLPPKRSHWPCEKSLKRQVARARRRRAGLAGANGGIDTSGFESDHGFVGRARLLRRRNGVI
jgi:HNH endonuclease